MMQNIADSASNTVFLTCVTTAGSPSSPNKPDSCPERQHLRGSKTSLV